MLFAPLATVERLAFGNQWLQWSWRAVRIKSSFPMKAIRADVFSKNAFENTSQANVVINTSWPPNAKMPYISQECILCSTLN